MGILDRLSTILRANINAMLDQAEDPEKTLDLADPDMRDAIGQARGRWRRGSPRRSSWKLDMERNMNLSREWGQKAELAVKRNADSLAREALRRKSTTRRTAKPTPTSQSQQEVVTKLKHDLEQLEQKYEGAVRIREVLIARHRRAVAQQKVAQTAAQLTTMDPTSELGRMEGRIRLKEARWPPPSPSRQRPILEEQFAALEGRQRAGRQMADLKGAGERAVRRRRRGLRRAPPRACLSSSQQHRPPAGIWGGATLFPP